MSRLLIPSLFCAALAFTGGACLAQEEPKKKDGDHAADAVKPIEGTIISVSDGKLVASVGKKKQAIERTFTTDAKTTVTLEGGKEGTLADLKASMKVLITATGDAATAIKAVAAKEKKPAEKKPDEK